MDAALKIATKKQVMSFGVNSIPNMAESKRSKKMFWRSGSVRLCIWIPTLCSLFKGNLDTTAIVRIFLCVVC